jgi:hypothetical protein
MLLSLQVADIKALGDERTPGASLYGATDFEKKTVIAGKVAHYGRCWGILRCGVASFWHIFLLVLRCSAQLHVILA